MPTYQYACKTCGAGFEKKLRMSQASETQTCPECGSQETRKRLGAVAVGGARRSATAVSAPPPSSPFT